MTTGEDDSSAVAGGVGMVYPPPEIRKIVDTTAAFVARNGIQFEARIREDQKHDPKFCFLNPNDPYHPYYAHKVKQETEGKGETKKADTGQTTTAAPQPSGPEVKPPPKEPPSFEFIAEMPSISAQDLDILRLTAQFVARNGRQFLSALSQRESRNYQFDFLRPNHSLFNYFTSMVAQYNKVLLPVNAQFGRLRASAVNKYGVLDRINERVEFAKYQEEQKKLAEQEADLEKRAHAMIDWHDFIVVDTVEFTDADESINLPPPMNIMDLESMTLAQKRAATVFDASTTGMDIDGGDSFNGPDSAASIGPSVPQLPVGAQLPPRPAVPQFAPAPPMMPGWPPAAYPYPRGAPPPMIPPAPLPTLPPGVVLPTGVRQADVLLDGNDPKRQRI